MNQSGLIQKILSREQIFTFSNLLSFLRLLMAFYIYSLILHQKSGMALFFALLAVVTDFADGYFARKWDQISEWGKIIDPLADKFCTGLASIALYQSYGLPAWVVAVVIGRDIFILFGSIILMSRFKYVTASEMPGKIAVTVISAMLLSFLLRLYPLQVPLEVLTAIFILYSGCYYVYKTIIKLIHKENQPE